MLKKIKLDSIVMDAGTQIRLEICENTVEAYCELYKEKEKLPPMIVFEIDGKYILADGFHRKLGAESAGLKIIEADVLKGTHQDCIKRALGANSKHGLRRTIADKRNAVMIAVERFPEMSQREIAKMCVVSHTFVQNLMAPSGNVAAPKWDSDSTVQEKSDVDDSPRTQPPQKPPSKSAPKPPSKPPQKQPQSAPDRPRDAEGWIIPPEAQSVWNRRQEIQKTLTELSSLKTFMESARESGDMMYASIGANDWHEIINGLSNARRFYEEAKPHAVCIACKGKIPETCMTCNKRGMLSEFFWKTHVTEEQKEMRRKALEMEKL